MDRSSKFHKSSAGSQPKAQICLIGASLNSDNRGVAALAAGTVTAALSACPQAEVFLLDYGRSPARYHVRHKAGRTEVELLNIRFSKKVLLKNNIARLLLATCWYRLLPTRKLKESFLANNPILRRIVEADVIGSIAGGDSFSDIYGMIRLLYVSLPQVLVILLGRPLVLLPQTLGPFKSSMAKRIARWTMRRAEIVYARDRESLVEIQPLIGNDSSRLRFSYDMAFAMEPFPPSGERMLQLRKLDGCRPLVGLNVSGLLYMGGYSGDNMFGLKADYRQLVRDIVHYFVQKNAHVLLVSHVSGGGEGSESDTTACAEIHREIESKCGGRLHLLEGEYDHQEIKHVIGRCDFFLGSRMHACIAALSQCVPAIGLAYSRKFRGVLDSIQVPNLVVDLRDHDTTEIIRRVGEAYRLRAKIREHLEKTMPSVRQTVLNLFSRTDLAVSKIPRSGSDSIEPAEEAPMHR